jgi:hypothetical protein
MIASDGKNDPARSFRDPQFQIPRCGGKDPIPVAIALGHPFRPTR